MWKFYYLIRYGLWKGDKDKGDERREDKDKGDERREDRKEYKPGAVKVEKKVRNVSVI